MKLYPFGYSNLNAQQTLDALMTSDPDMWIVDIRLQAWSHHEEWRGAALRQQWKGRYVHVYQLGNLNYANNKPIELRDEQGGMMRLENILKHRSVVLMCACKDADTCHRSIVVDLVRASMPDVEIVLDELQQEQRDVVVAVSQDFGLDRWVDEGQLPDEAWNGLEYHFYLGGNPPDIQPGARVYIVHKGALRGYAPLIRIDHFNGYYGLVRHGGAMAVTIPEYIQGFRGFRYRWWNRDLEVPFPDWQNPDATPPGRPKTIERIQQAKAEPEKKVISIKDFWTAQDATQKQDVMEALKPVPYKTRCVIEVDGKVI